LTRDIAARLSARLLKQFGSPENVFRAPLRQLETCELPAATAQAIVKKEAFKRAEKELLAIRALPGCQLVNWSEPEYPQTLLQIYDPPVLLYVRGDAQILNAPSRLWVRVGQRFTGRRWQTAWRAIWRRAALTPSPIRAQ
jgi:DNA processing protein